MEIHPVQGYDTIPFYNFCIDVPELQVSSNEPFMHEQEFSSAVDHPDSTMFLAEDGGQIVGFIYARVGDIDRVISTKCACIVYLAVDPAHQRQGIAQRLYEECVRALTAKGVTDVYCWANTDSPAVMDFMKKQGLQAGKTCIWMDGKI